MAKEAYLSREDVLKILKINDEKLDALVKEGKLQEKKESWFNEEDIIMYATEYPPELEEEEMKILPSIEEPVEEEKEEEIEILAPHEETAEEELMPTVDEGLRIEPTEDEAKAEPKVEPEREDSALFESRELAAPRKSPFFIFLSLLSFVIVLASIGILALPILGIAIPEFIKPAVDFVSEFIKPAVDFVSGLL